MKLFFIVILLTTSFFASGQSILGKWYSADSTRIYRIYKKADQFEAVLLTSDRKADKVGTIILKDLTFMDKKKKFVGRIYSTLDSSSTLAKIKFQDKDGRVLLLKLQRMFFMDITIKWYRVEENKIVTK